MQLLSRNKYNYYYYYLLLFVCQISFLDKYKNIIVSRITLNFQVYTCTVWEFLSKTVFDGVDNFDVTTKCKTRTVWSKLDEFMQNTDYVMCYSGVLFYCRVELEYV